MATLRTVRPLADVIALDSASNATGARPSGAALAGIVIDVPDVLYDATLWRRWLFQLIHRLGAGVCYAEFERAWDQQLVDVVQGRREYGEALQSLLLALGVSWAQIDEIEAAGRIQRRNLELNVRALPSAARVIDQLAGLRVPLVAWADLPQTAERLSERLARLGFAGRFSSVLTSFDLETTQPAAECYRAMLSACGLKGGCQPAARQVIYVGHDARHLAAASRQGFRTAAFNFAVPAPADHSLLNLDELVTLARAFCCEGVQAAA